MKKLLYVGALSALLLAACGGEEEAAPKDEPKEETKVETPVQEPAKEVAATWNEQISTLASNSDAASDKFYSLEKYMMDYEATPEEVDQFKTDIVNDYKSGTYLSELENHERMLSNIFKSYIVEQNTDGAIKDFTFDYYQNLKYTYRGADAVDSESVKSNEIQMNKALETM